jgi:type 1 glutamine amidotransferase
MRASLLALALTSTLALAGCDSLRVFFPKKAYETAPAELPADLKAPALLLFTKTNGFRHTEGIPAGVALVTEIARRRGWAVFHTESGGVFNDAQLARFEATMWHQVSGDVLTEAQRASFQRWLEAGGGFIGVHGAGGDGEYAWRWYVETLIGAQFIGHTMGPQFQTATWRVENAAHPATKNLPVSWQHEEEIYSFDASVRSKPGYEVLVSVDESTYSPQLKFLWQDRSIAMGADHPMVWRHCIGRGRALYSAIGHQAKTYDVPEVKALTEGALAWAMRAEGEGCD